MLSGELEAHSTFAKLGENLVMRVDRTGYDLSRGASRIMTKVELDMDNIKPLDDVEYELSAVVYHDGLSTDYGHYTVFRKHDGDWHILNDKQCSKTKKEDVGDLRKYGQSTMLLWKKAKT